MSKNTNTNTNTFEAEQDLLIPIVTNGFCSWSHCTASCGQIRLLILWTSRGLEATTAHRRLHLHLHVLCTFFVPRLPTIVKRLERIIRR
jgi:hypothetical protein